MKKMKNFLKDFPKHKALWKRFDYLFENYHLKYRHKFKQILFYMTGVTYIKHKALFRFRVFLKSVN